MTESEIFLTRGPWNGFDLSPPSTFECRPLSKEGSGRITNLVTHHVQSCESHGHTLLKRKKKEAER